MNDPLKNVIEAAEELAAIIANVVKRLDDLELRVAEIERSVVLMPGLNPTERVP